MADEPVLDTNDQALIGQFLRAMYRFEKFVRAQGPTYICRLCQTQLEQKENL